MTRRRITPPFTPLKNSMISVDAGPIRDALIRKYRRVSKETQQTRNKIQKFEEEGKSAFAEWHRKTFFKDLHELQDHQQRITHLTLVLEALDLESLYLKKSKRQVYPLIEERMERGEDPLSIEARAHFRELEEERVQYEREQMERLRTGQVSQSDEERYRADFEDLLIARIGPRIHTLSRADLEDLFHDYLDALHERASASSRRTRRDETRDHDEHHPSDRPTEPDTAQVEPDLQIRVKKIYRELAFRLHPDLNADLGQREKDIWIEVQLAYETQDLERLEILKGLLESTTEAGIESISQLSRILDLIEEVIREHKALKNRIRSLNTDLTYRFWKDREKQNKLQSLKKEISLTYRGERESLSEHLKDLERQFRRFSKTERPSPKSGKRR